MSFKFEDPKDWFLFELDRAHKAQVLEPTAMALATVDAMGFPNVRTVLYKGWRDSGLSFFTNYDSPKSKSLIQNPKACVNFFWANLNQQVRIQGLVHKLSAEESQDYFWSRPRLSQIGAWASNQSAAINSYQELEDKVQAYTKKFESTEKIPCPPHWGGFVMTPLSYEFWFGLEGRLHERYHYHRRSVLDTAWIKSMLSP